MTHSHRLAKLKLETCGDHRAEALVFTCMDFRMIEPVAAYMASRGLAGRYDHIALAGAALGIAEENNPVWSKTFWEHLTLARQMHGVGKLIVIDHRDCGACKKFVGPDCADDPEAELATHRRYLEKLAEDVAEREPGLDVELLLMDLDGQVTEIVHALSRASEMRLSG